MLSIYETTYVLLSHSKVKKKKKKKRKKKEKASQSAEATFSRMQAK
jgi:hypothetical protein